MPELPEVETTAAELRPALVGARFTGAQILWPRTLAQPDPAALTDRLAGRTVISLGRRGKYLLIWLDSGAALIVHLRMSGRLTVADGADPAEFTHVRATFPLADGRRLIFDDARKFGRIWLADDPASVVGGLGPEPLAWDFTPEVLAERLRGRRVALKALLLDQRVVAGLGNIYADEALFWARLHPLRRAADLDSAEIVRLHAAIVQVLRAAVAKLGTTLRDYRPPYSQRGAYGEELRVYQQTGKPCPRCGAAIERIRVTQRSTHFCPQCQPIGLCSITKDAKDTKGAD